MLWILLILRMSLPPGELSPPMQEFAAEAHCIQEDPWGDCTCTVYFFGSKVYRFEHVYVTNNYRERYLMEMCRLDIATIKEHLSFHKLTEMTYAEYERSIYRTWEDREDYERNFGALR
jgi:hypothetical protein